MRSDRPSFTSMAVAGMRAVYAELPAPFGAGSDPLATNLLPFPFLLPAHLIERLGAFPNAGVTLHRAYGTISAGLTWHVALRTRAIDGAMHECVAAGAKQVVVLGAGLDGRAFRVSELTGLRVFEVDHPSTQRDKQNRLAKTNLQSFANVSFVPVDFEKDRLDACLLSAGFSKEEPSFWIWEGVTAYLTRDAIMATLQAIASVSVLGSRVAMTYVRPPAQGADPSRPIVYRGMRALVHVGATVLGAMGEPVRGFMDSQQLLALVESAGFRIHADENARQWAQRYWQGESSGPFEWERLAILEWGLASSR